ncbi:MAG: hypothetical protein R3B48_30310 [Kofleriaceae bacterium]
MRASPGMIAVDDGPVVWPWMDPALLRQRSCACSVSTHYPEEAQDLRGGLFI